MPGDNLTPLDCLFMSDVAYDFSKTACPFGWNRWVTNDQVRNANQYGYYGIAFTNHETKQIVIASRGTNSFSHLISDVDFALGEIPEAHHSAKIFATYIRQNSNNYEIIHTGHSLGGIHAQLSAYEYGEKAIVFESPGIKKITHLLSCQCKSSCFHITNYLSPPNPINSFGSQVGSVVEIRLHKNDYATAINALNMGPESLIGGLGLAALSIPLSTVAFPIAAFAISGALTVSLVGNIEGLVRYTYTTHGLQTMIAAFDLQTGSPYHSKLKQYNPIAEAAYYNKLGDKHFDQKEYKQAIEDYSNAIHLNKNNAIYYASRALSKYKLDSTDKSALDDYAEAIYLDSNVASYYNPEQQILANRAHAALFNRQGNAQNKNEQYGDAVRSFTEAINVDNTVAVYYTNRALSRYILNSHDENAGADYLNAVRLDPDVVNCYNLEQQKQFCKMYAVFFNQQGNIQNLQGKYKEAIDSYTTAINTDNTVAEYYANRALSRHSLNQHDQNAYMDYLNAIKLDSNVVNHYGAKEQFQFSRINAAWQKTQQQNTREKTVATSLSRSSDLFGTHANTAAKKRSLLPSKSKDRFFETIQPSSLCNGKTTNRITTRQHSIQSRKQDIGLRY